MTPGAPVDAWRLVLAAFPLALLLVGLLVLGWPGMRAAAVTLVLTVVLAAAAFGAPLHTLAVALYRASALSLHVLYII